MVPINMASMKERVEKSERNVKRKTFCHARRTDGRMGNGQLDRANKTDDLN